MPSPTNEQDLRNLNRARILLPARRWSDLVVGAALSCGIAAIIASFLFD